MNSKTEEFKDLLEYLYLESELNIYEIAEQFGVGKNTIWNWLKEFNIPRRTNSEVNSGRHNPNFGVHRDGKSSGGYRHGGRWTRLYKVWQDMKARCYRLTRKDYKWYGGKGIKVCSEWVNDFAVFREFALTHGYTDELTIDRKDSNKGYFPDNVQFISREENTKKNNAYGGNRDE